jgi:FkbM family methyltransferase
MYHRLSNEETEPETQAETPNKNGCEGWQKNFCVVMVSVLLLIYLLSDNKSTAEEESAFDFKKLNNVEFADKAQILVVNKSPSPKKLRMYNSDFAMLTHTPEDDVYISKSIQNGKFWDQHTSQLLIAELSAEKPNFLEIGVNIGSIFVPVAHRSESLGGKAIGIEANAENFGLADANIILNGLKKSVGIHRAITDDRKAMPESVMSSSHGNRGGSSVSTDSEAGEMKTPTIELDELFEKDPVEFCRIGAMKLDVEGFEAKALYGGMRFLQKCKPCFIRLEFTPMFLKKYGTPAQKFLNDMKDIGYADKNFDSEAFIASGKIQTDINLRHETCII